MPDIRFDRYYRYDEIAALLQSYAAEYPALVQVESIGTSYEGREVWIAILTNTATGPHGDKPALYVDGNIHATEVSPSSACLYLINHLTTNYGTDPDVTRALDSRTFYIAPRVNPDGAEWFLSDKPRRIRSSTRPYPYDEEPTEGLIEGDIDGDGRHLWMRIKDPNGPWKAAMEDPRLMVLREPEDTEGDFYWVFPEGELRGYDGSIIKIIPKKEGLDLNRNFPAYWREEYQQMGAGLFPTSEPEVRNIVKFITEHSNIIGGVAFHTWSGVLLRPYGSRADEEMPAEDLWTYKKIGEKGTAITGYPNISVYHDFRYHPKQVITGDFDEWAYDAQGIFSWTVEIWSPQRQAGIEEYKFIDWYREHPREDDLKLLKWNDEMLGGEGFVTWYEADHPQLGKVELGGWDHDLCWRNPPPQFLEKEIAPFSEWLVWKALLAPQLALYKLEVNPLGGDSYHVEMVVENGGWLPSYVTKKAVEKKLTRGVIFEIELPENGSLEAGRLRFEGPQLEGRATNHRTITPWTMWQINMNARTKYEWVVKAPAGSSVTVTARHDRAGAIRETITLG